VRRAAQNNGGVAVVKLTYLGHSAFLLEADGKRVLVDPFLTGNPKAAKPASEVDAETILLTHAHGDHVGDTVEIAKRNNATVIATFELGTWLEQQGVAGAIAANHGGTVAFDGGTTKLVPAWHTSSYGDDFQAPGVPAGHVVRFGGKTIYFAGDTCLFSDMQLIGEEGLDVAVVPIGDHFTMGPADACRAVTFLQPKVVIPCHYDTFPPIKQDPRAFKRQVDSQTGATAVVLAPGESYEVE
jgi:L-ascorbate metabolism protein UlaG (beta-lactamase superfamily)